DARMRVDHALDLRRIDVLAPHDDHVRPPVDEVEIALGVEVADVAEGLPAIVGRARGRADITIGRSLPARRQEEDVADLARRAVPPVLADDAHAATGGRPTDRAGMREPLAPADQRAP